jgi:hypothetical protein
MDATALAGESAFTRDAVAGCATATAVLSRNSQN